MKDDDDDDDDGGGGFWVAVRSGSSLFFKGGRLRVFYSTS